jgi:hypothetical protein
MSKLPTEYLRHMYDECLFITETITPEMTKDQLLEDETLRNRLKTSGEPETRRFL